MTKSTKNERKEIGSPSRTTQATRLKKEQYFRTTNVQRVPTSKPKSLNEAHSFMKETDQLIFQCELDILNTIVKQRQRQRQKKNEEQKEKEKDKEKEKIEENKDVNTTDDGIGFISSSDISFVEDNVKSMEKESQNKEDISIKDKNENTKDKKDNDFIVDVGCLSVLQEIVPHHPIKLLIKALEITAVDGKQNSEAAVLWIFDQGEKYLNNHLSEMYG